MPPNSTQNSTKFKGHPKLHLPEYFKSGRTPQRRWLLKIWGRETWIEDDICHGSSFLSRHSGFKFSGSTSMIEAWFFTFSIFSPRPFPFPLHGVSHFLFQIFGRSKRADHLGNFVHERNWSAKGHPRPHSPRVVANTEECRQLLMGHFSRVALRCESTFTANFATFFRLCPLGGPWSTQLVL